MISVAELTEKLQTYIASQLTTMAETSPVIGFIKPLITRALDKNFSKVTKTLDLIADKDGNVDVEGILSEMIDNVVSTKPFTLRTSFIGNVEVGGGEIKLNLPLTNKRLIFNQADLETFKEILTTK